MSKIAATIAASLAAATFALAIPATAPASTGTSPGATSTSTAGPRSGAGADRHAGGQTGVHPAKPRASARPEDVPPAPAASKIDVLNAKLGGLCINLPK